MFSKAFLPILKLIFMLGCASVFSIGCPNGQSKCEKIQEGFYSAAGIILNDTTEYCNSISSPCCFCNCWDDGYEMKRESTLIDCQCQERYISEDNVFLDFFFSGDPDCREFFETNPDCEEDPDSCIETLIWFYNASSVDQCDWTS
jgi:hypothetical protein